MNRAASNLVLIASPRAAWVDSLKRWLEAAGMRGVRAGASLEGSLEEVNPRLVVVDTTGSPPDAIGICAAICLGSPDVPVLVIVAPGDSETVEQAVELGISHFAEEPITPKVLALRVEALVRAAGGRTTGRERRVDHPTGRDGLTGLASRSAFLETMNRVTEQARTRGHLAALLYLDLDRFRIRPASRGLSAQLPSRRVDLRLRSAYHDLPGLFGVKRGPVPDSAFEDPLRAMISV